MYVNLYKKKKVPPRVQVSFDNSLKYKFLSKFFVCAEILTVLFLPFLPD